MKIRMMWAAVGSCLFMAGAADAQVVSVDTTTSVNTGNPLNGLQQDDLITLNVRLSKIDTTTNIFGLGIAVFGYNPAVVQFVSGEIFFQYDAENDVFLQTEFFKLSAAGVGVPNIMPSGTLIQDTAPGFGPYVRFVNAASTTGRRGNGSFDVGIDGTPSSPEARIVFRVIPTSGSTTFTIGTSTNATVGNVVVLAGGATQQAINSTVNITVPEPEAVLAGIGAIGTALAAAGMRRRLSA